MEWIIIPLTDPLDIDPDKGIRIFAHCNLNATKLASAKDVDATGKELLSDSHTQLLEWVN